MASTRGRAGPSVQAHAEKHLFIKLARQKVLHQIVGIAALLGGDLRQFRLQLPSNVQFHFVRLPSLLSQTQKRRGGESAMIFPAA
jgi:hypothetical protein